MAIDIKGIVWKYDSSNLKLEKVDLIYVNKSDAIQNTKFKLVVSSYSDIFLYDSFGFFWTYSKISSKLYQHYALKYRKDIINDDILDPNLITFHNKIIKIYVNNSTNDVFVKDDNNNFWCYLGSGQGLFSVIKDNIEDIKCYSDHTVLIDSNGVIYMEGYNRYGQFGIETTESIFKSRVIKTPFTADNLAGCIKTNPKIKCSS